MLGAAHDTAVTRAQDYVALAKRGRQAPARRRLTTPGALFKIPTENHKRRADGAPELAVSFNVSIR
jgi:hypothetical protein